MFTFSEINLIHIKNDIKRFKQVNLKAGIGEVTDEIIRKMSLDIHKFKSDSYVFTNDYIYVMDVCVKCLNELYIEDMFK